MNALDVVNELDAVNFESGAHHTAMRRAAPSLPARRLLVTMRGAVSQVSQAETSGDIIDFGCGRGADVAFYSQEGFDVEGYDPHEDFGYPMPERKFKIGICNYVLNVIADSKTRIDVISHLADSLVEDGVVFLVTRSFRVIEQGAVKGRWTAWQDGYISNKERMTFQKGFSEEELIHLGKEAGLVPYEVALPSIRDATVVAFKKA